MSSALCSRYGGALPKRGPRGDAASTIDEIRTQGLRGDVRQLRDPQLLAEVLVDVSTGTDSKNEHHQSIVFDVVNHPVSADADAAPAR